MRIRVAASMVVVMIAVASASDVSSNAGEWVTCESFSLKSIPVVGAPNPFCLVDEPCKPDSVDDACPGAGSYDLHGVLLSLGSCCALLDGAGAVGCVSRQLIGTSFQCIGSTLPPRKTPLPPRSESGSGSRADSVYPDKPGTPSPTPTFPTTGPVVTTRPPTVQPTTTPPAATDSSSSSSSLGSQSTSSSSDGEPDAGDEPITTPPSPMPSLPRTFEPIIEEPTPTPTKDVSSPVDSQGNANNNSGDTNAATGVFYASLDSNMALMLVLGSVATIAVIVGAFVLRRGSGGSMNDGRSTKHSESTLPPLTPPYMDDFFDDDGWKTLETFSPIRVHSANPYAAASTPGRDQPSYFL